MKETVVFFNGLFTPLRDARVSVLDRGFCYGDGLFETMRAYSNRVFRIDAHLDRLFRSAEMIFLDLPMTRGEVRKAITETLERNECPDAIIRLTVSRGEHSPGLKIDPDISPTVVVFVRPFEPLPRKWYAEGIKITLFPNSAGRTGGLREQVKSCNYLSQVIIRELSAKDGAYEGIMLDERNLITEGTTSNIFIVTNGTLRTPTLNEYVLAGITRKTVLEVARDRGIPSYEENLTREDVYQADEVFLTNTGIEILPVRMADDRIVGEGRPGALTRLLGREFSKNVAECI